MRFWLLDKIESYEPGERLRASKQVTYAEEYLQDHFPEFPVLPGVFMLEAATQAAAWLLRLSDDYEHSVISLKEAKNIKYADFVRPGSRLDIEVELIKKDERLATFKAVGKVGDSTSLTGRLVVERYNLADADPAQAEVDAHLRNYLSKVEVAILPGGRPALAST